MELSRSVARVRDMILKAGLVDELQMRSAIAKMEQWGGRLPNTLVEMGFVDEDEVTKLLGQNLRIQVMHLGDVHKDSAAVSRLDASYCETHAIFPVSLKNRVLTLAMADPNDLPCIDEVGLKANARVVPVLAAESEIMGAISRHYHGREPKKRSTRAREMVTAEIPEIIHAGGAGGLQLDTTMPPPPGMTHTSQRTTTSSMGAVKQAASANTLLDEILDDGGDAGGRDGFSAEDLKRVENAAMNQKKTAAILRALTELLHEKGYL